MLFLDVEGFTSFAETRPPQEVLATLHAFFDTATETIAGHGGVVIDLIGDALLATFNIPLAEHDHAAAGMRAAADLIRSADATRFEGTRFGVRIGIATGPVAAGSVGGRRQTYTVYGDTVNLAQRLEQLNKQADTRVLISEATAGAARDLPVRSIGNVSVKGRSKAARIFTLAAPIDAGSEPIQADIAPQMPGEAIDRDRPAPA